MIRYNPFRGDTFVAATICSMVCQYELRQPLEGTGLRFEVWQVFAKGELLAASD